MSEIVEGTWKNFVFKMLTMEDTENKKRVFEHLRKNFYQDEPICNSFGGISEDSVKEFEQFYENIPVFQDNLSFFAEDKDTNEIAGVRLTFVHRKTTDFSNLNFKSSQLTFVFKVLGKIEKKANFLERMGIDEFVNFITASTDKRYRGQGLATEMYKRSLNLLRAKGHHYVKSVFTSPWSRKAVGNLGFSELARIFYKDFETDDGKEMFPNMPKDEFCSFMYIKL